MVVGNRYWYIREEMRVWREWRFGIITRIVLMGGFFERILRVRSIFRLLFENYWCKLMKYECRI